MKPTIHHPSPGTRIITTGTVENGDWFFIESLGAWGLVPPCGLGEQVSACGHIIARAILPEHNVVERAKNFWLN